MEVVIVSVVSLFSNILLGKWRVNYKKFTFKWWLLIHASIPIIIPLRIWLKTPAIFIPLFIALAIAGQFIGTRMKVGSVGKS